MTIACVLYPTRLLAVVAHKSLGENGEPLLLDRCAKHCSAGTWCGYGLVAYGMAILESPKKTMKNKRMSRRRVNCEVQTVN